MMFFQLNLCQPFPVSFVPELNYLGYVALVLIDQTPFPLSNQRSSNLIAALNSTQEHICDQGKSSTGIILSLYRYFITTRLLLDMVLVCLVFILADWCQFCDSVSHCSICSHTHTHTHTSILQLSELSGITRVSQFQKDQTSLDFTEARDSEWQWHELSDMQIVTSLQRDNHASTHPLSFLLAK